MREDKLSTNYTDIVQQRSKSGAQDNIDLNDNWFTPYIEEDTRKPPNHEPSVTPENTYKMITLLQYVLHEQESPSIEGASVSEVIKLPASERV